MKPLIAPMARRYAGASSAAGPLLFVESTRRAQLGEWVRIEDDDQLERRGQVIDVGDEITVQQAIEHLDAGGCTGSLVDVLTALKGKGQETPSDSPDCIRHGLLPNRRLSVLMVPPSHRERIRPLLASLRSEIQ